MKKTISLFLVIIMMLALAVGCAAPGKEPTEEPTGVLPSKEPVTEPGEKIRVALILEGAISDMSWNATAYNGLKEIENMGAEVAYIENIPASSVADSIRVYADEGYDVIFLSTNSYQEVAKSTAPDYPDTQFMMINSAVILENVSSFSIQDAQQGFMMGVIAALTTKTNKVGFIGGLEITPILNGAKGFEQGAKYINPEIEVVSTNTGSFDDVNKAKETAKAMIDQGVDVLAPMANQSSLGVMEAAEEGGAKAIAPGQGMDTVAPKAAVCVVVKDTAIAYKAAYQYYLDNALPDTIIPMGAEQGVVFIGEYYAGADELTDDAKAKIEEAYNGLKDGSITIDLG